MLYNLTVKMYSQFHTFHPVTPTVFVLQLNCLGVINVYSVNFFYFMPFHFS